MTASADPAPPVWDASKAFAGDGGTSATLEQRLEEALRVHRDARASGTPEELASAAERLNELYWPLLDRAMVRVSSNRPEAGSFSLEDMLLVNFGILDPELLPPRITDALMAEYRQPGGERVRYLADHFTELVRTRRAEGAAAQTQAGPGPGQYASRLRDTRLKVLKRLGPFIEGLPGVTADVAGRFLSGKLDEDLLRINLTLLDRPERLLFVHRRRLKALRGGLLEKARRRARTAADAQLFDLLHEVYLRDWRERFQAISGTAADDFPEPGAEASAASGAEADDVDDDLLRHLREEVARFRLAAGQGGQPRADARTGPAMLADTPRATRADILRIVALAGEIDREGPVTVQGLILPFGGRGAVVWESGVWLVGLRPPVSTEDSTATVLGQYRVMADGRQHGGRLAQAYAKAFPGSAFEQDFVADYRIFLTRTARGDAKALAPARWAFFRDQIALPAQGPPVPLNLAAVGPQTRELLVARLEKQVAAAAEAGGGDALACKRLAILYWMNRRAGEAVKLFKESLRLNPNDAETALALGRALQAAGQTDAADEVLRLGVERGAGTLWSVFCRDALGLLEPGGGLPN